jgi:acetolactate synthase I/II/III large subunit
MKVYETLAEAFVAEGTDTVFGLMGDGNMFWMGAIAERSPVRVIHARHENMAVAMADGYSRLSGRVGVCSVTCGPGMTQIATSLTAAVRHASPIVVFAGDTPLGAAFHLQEFEQRPYVESTGARFIGVTSTDRLAEDVQQAFALARNCRLPVVLSVPYDLQDRESDWTLEYQRSDAIVVNPQRLGADPSVLAEAAELIAGARKPIILAGRGAVAAGARDAAVRLGEQTGALLATSLRAKDWFDGQTFNAGICGAFATDAARELFVDADLVIGIGARLGYYTTEAGYLFPEAKIIQIDIEPHPYLDGQRTADTFLHADARSGVEALTAELAGRLGGAARIGYRTPENADRLARIDVDGAEYELEPHTVDPRTAVAEFDEAVPKHWTTVIGAGHYWNFTVPILRGREPQTYVYTYDFGVIGQGLPNAIGASIAGPQPVALIEGDGSLLMNIQELETIARHDIPLLIVAMNDGAYGAEVHKMRSKSVSGEEAVFGRPDLAAVARSFGVRGHTVTAPGQLRDAVETHLADPIPTLIDVHMSANVLSRQYRRLFFGKA